MTKNEGFADPILTAEKYGFIEGDEGEAFIGFGFSEAISVPSTKRFFVGLPLDEIEELIVTLQDHVQRHREV